ncbi:CCN family member 1-like isoform X2 [Brienomyrus brachyistius]|uniref:CCN family member 1-like isoform X2 n=1 Tax=Brienomyrus brachyistius TaxID=42636 RepID=UPI0020B200A1|nr:CCN family member 1-like isoform X2 [Brienomyrus brachyistius]
MKRSGEPLRVAGEAGCGTDTHTQAGSEHRQGLLSPVVSRTLKLQRRSHSLPRNEESMFAPKSLAQASLLVLLPLLCITAATGNSSCPQVCSCPTSPPICPPGVSLATDACGCCRVCARQFNQDCGPSQPCDHIKGLRCQMGANGDPERGLCRDAQGRPCEFGGRLYQHGEHFQPSCQHQCSCMDGVLGCMPLCPHRMPLPDPRCASPRLLRPEGRCCEEWVCEDSNHVGEGPVGPLAHPNAISSAVLPPPGPRHPGTAGTFQEWKSRPHTFVQSLQTTQCLPQTTDWSECSATCGMGVSSRVTNSNAECQLIRETRLCQIRLCDPEVRLQLKRGKKCQRTVWPQEPVRITFAGCSTARRYRPRSCGSCSDSRCCTPSLTRTVRLRFHCPDGESFSRRLMWIRHCRCRRHCPAHRNPSGPSISLHNDVHTYAPLRPRYPSPPSRGPVKEP